MTYPFTEWFDKPYFLEKTYPFVSDYYTHATPEDLTPTERKHIIVNVGNPNINGNGY